MVVFGDHVDLYKEELDKKYEVCEVPLRIASDETLRDFGRLVRDFEKEEVKYRKTIRNWRHEAQHSCACGTL